MWLLNVKSRLLENFLDDRDICDKYAILSHTWGGEEVLFEELHLESSRRKKGYRKIDYTCLQAQKDDLDYAWIDTCKPTSSLSSFSPLTELGCIDKRSSAELSENINSMYRYYANSKVCYVYLEDFNTPTSSADDKSPGHAPLDALMEEALRPCRWFTRGWTLQELIAPSLVLFYDIQWTCIGSKYALHTVLASITRVDESILRDPKLLNRANVAKKMSFAANRKTTREEDRAYSLLGIFDVNMPLLYGEGPKAFARLQQEIIQGPAGSDHSILVWAPAAGEPRRSLFADSPDDFASCSDITSWSPPVPDAPQLTNQGLQLNTFVGDAWQRQDLSTVMALLNCRLGAHRVGLYLSQQEDAPKLEQRQENSKPKGKPPLEKDQTAVRFCYVTDYRRPGPVPERPLPDRFLGRDGSRVMALLERDEVAATKSTTISISRHPPESRQWNFKDQEVIVELTRPLQGPPGNERSFVLPLRSKSAHENNLFGVGNFWSEDGHHFELSIESRGNNWHASSDHPRLIVRIEMIITSTRDATKQLDTPPAKPSSLAKPQTFSNGSRIVVGDFEVATHLTNDHGEILWVMEFRVRNFDKTHPNASFSRTHRLVRPTSADAGTESHGSVAE